jgi:DNA-directed RNA polymerase specialized sigma24 family protein
MLTCVLLYALLGLLYWRFIRVSDFLLAKAGERRRYANEVVASWLTRSAQIESKLQQTLDSLESDASEEVRAMPREVEGPSTTASTSASEQALLAKTLGGEDGTQRLEPQTDFAIRDSIFEVSVGQAPGWRPIEAFSELLPTLSHDDRQIVVMAVLFGRSTDLIARSMDVPIADVDHVLRSFAEATRAHKRPRKGRQSQVG